MREEERMVSERRIGRKRNREREREPPALEEMRQLGREAASQTKGTIWLWKKF